MRHFRLLLPFSLTLLVGLPGCGYQFQVEGNGPTVGGERVVKTEGPPVLLAIDPLQNRTFERDLEIKYSQYLRRQFKLNSGAEVVKTPQEADFLLAGAIESVSLPSLTFTQNQTQESRVSVQVKVEVKNLRTGQVLWVQSANGTAELFVNASPEGEGGQRGLQFNRILQNRALEQAGQAVAVDLSDRFLIAREKGVFTPPPPETKDQGEAAPTSTPNQRAPLSEPLPSPDRH
jgi:outer membrane lipopolysaccharide assembly protein LptE/RlpB